MSEPLCDECPLGNKRNKKIVKFQAPEVNSNGLVLIGEQPAFNEWKDGVPFVGKSGIFLDKVLAQVGIDRKACYVTNSFHCFESDMKDTDRIKAAKACRPRLIAELQSFESNVIYALGGVALKSITNDWKASIEAFRGSMLNSSVGNMLAEDVPFVSATCSYHPAAILRSTGQIADIFFDDTLKVSNWLSNGVPEWQDAYMIAPKEESLYMFLGQLKQNYGGAVVDVECIYGDEQEKFNRWFDKLRMIGIGWKDLAAVIPWLDGEWQQHYNQKEFDGVKKVLRDFFELKDTFTIYHNFQYDVPVLGRHGLPVKNLIHDTMEAHYSLYHMGVRHGLGYVAQQYLDVPPWKQVHGKEHEASDFMTEAIYNSRDIRTTAAIWEILSQLVLQENIWPTYEMCMMNNIIALSMSEYGINVDVEEYQKVLSKWSVRKSEDQRKLLDAANVGPTQMDLYERMRQIKIDAMSEAKLSSFSEGLLSSSDPYSLINTVNESEGRIIWKKGSKEIRDAVDKLTPLLDTAEKDIVDLYTVCQVGKAVREKKQSKEDVTQEEFDVLPIDSMLEARSILREASEKMKEKDVEKLRELHQLENERELKDPEKNTLARLSDIASGSLEKPNDLKRLKASDWTKIEKRIRGKVGKVAQATKTLSKRYSRAVTRVPFVNFNSDAEAGRVIHEWFGLPIEVPLTSKGDYAVNEGALNHIKGHPIVKAYQGLVQSSDRWQWVKNLPIYPDGRVHPIYKPRLKSGRWSSGDSGPESHPLDTLNAQNIEEAMMSLFKAGRGKKFVGADFSGVELRVGGAMTGCRTLMDQFARYDAGLDLKVHGQTARLIWKEWAHLPLEEQKLHYVEDADGHGTDKYKMAKSGGFLTFYGGGWEALAAKIIEMEDYIEDPQQRANKEEEIREEARAFMTYLQHIWPEVFSVREEWYREARRTGRLKIGWLTGRFLRFPLMDEDHVSPTLCANAPVQSTAGEISHRGLMMLYKYLPSCCKIVLYIHDCIIIECPEDMAEDIKVLMKQCMEYWFEGPIGGILCKVNPKIGDSIAEVH
jgi:uracil-DNA glycosylase family 4